MTEEPIKNYNNIPGDPSHFVRGNLPKIKKAGGLHAYLDDLHARRGNLVRLRLGPFVKAVSSTSPAVISQLNKSANFDKRPPLIRASRSWLGEGNIAELSGRESRLTRAQLTPMLGKDSQRLACNVGVTVLERILPRLIDKSINLVEACRELALSTMGECCFGADFRSGLGADIGQHFMHVLRTNPIKPGPPFPPFWQPKYWHWRKDVRTLHKKVDELIQKRKLTGAEKYTDPSGDLLGLLLSARDENGELFFSESEARMAVLAFYFGGVEATSSSILWCAAYLGAQPDLMKKIQSELDTVLQGRAPTYDTLWQLPFMHSVIIETLRISAPSPVNMRLIQEDVLIDGYRVPKGTVFFLSIIAMHHNPELWPEPFVFKPERFINSDAEKYPRHAFMPFGVGAKGCIGGRFAITEISLALAGLLQRCSFSWPDTPELHGEFHSGALVPKSAHKLIVTTR